MVTFFEGPPVLNDVELLDARSPVFSLKSGSGAVTRAGKR
jgi:hypothetical protein